MSKSIQVGIREFPRDTVTPEHFSVKEVELAPLAPGEVLVRPQFLSLDPYMRMRLADARVGRFAMKPGDTMMGRTVGSVVESRDPAFKTGDVVLGWGGWRSLAVATAETLQKVEPVEGAPLSAYLGVLGRPGITAWLGVVSIAGLRAGETFLVSSAAGAVGSIAAQMARHLGAQVVGIAGGPAKCEAVTTQLGAHACIDYKLPDFEQRLQEATPEGVDVLFENVGAAVLDASLERMKHRGRVAVCGLIAQYHSGDPYAFRNFSRILSSDLRVTGFRIDSNSHLHAQAMDDLHSWYRAGVFRSWERVTQGLENAPEAFVSMLAGKGQGKTLIQLY